MDKEILARLDALAEKLGATGEYLWRALVRGEVVGGVVYIALGAFLGLICGLVAKWTLANRKDADSIDSGFWTMGFVFSVLIGTGLFAGFVSQGFLKVYAAEASALRTILGR